MTFAPLFVTKQQDAPYLCNQGRDEVRWRPGHEASLAPPYWNLRSFGSKFALLKKVLVTLLGLLDPPQSFGVPRGDLAPL